MRRDAVDRAVKRIHWTVPRFFKRCDKCDDDVKKEQMWWFKQYYCGPYAHLSWKTWTCRRCAPMMSDLFKAHPKIFGELDISCIEEEEKQYALHQESKGE